MLEIDINGNITVNKGDTFEAPIFMDINESKFDSSRLPVEDGWLLYFGVMEANMPFALSLVKKTLTKDDLNEHGDFVVKFSHDDTRCLMPGPYFYEAKLFIPGDESGEEDKIITVVPRRKFTLLN